MEMIVSRPDYFGYYKHMIQMLFAQLSDSSLESNEPSDDRKLFDVEGKMGSNPFRCTIDDIHLEKLRIFLQESVLILNEEVNEVLQCCFETTSGLVGREVKDHDVSCPKEPTIDEKFQSASSSVVNELRSMEQGLDELLDIVVSACREMTHAEKVELRWFIQHLPPESLDRVVDILGQKNEYVRNRNGHELHIELENEDHVTLWKLYFYVEAVRRASE